MCIYIYSQATHPDSSMWCPTRRSPQVLSTNVILTYVNRDLMGFHRELMGFHRDLMGFNRDLMRFYRDLMGFHRDLMRFYNIL